MLTPAIARPVSGAIGRPLARILGEPGKLGRENSMRSPRRTAQTASALMVGLALVSAIAVFGASLSKSATSSVDQAIKADLILTATGNGQSGFSTLIPTVTSAVPGVTAETTYYQGQFEIQGSTQSLAALATQHVADTVILRMTSGSAGALADGDLLIDSTTAANKHLATGDKVPVVFAKTGPVSLRIGGIYQANALIGSYLVSAALFQSHFYSPAPAAVLLNTNGSASVENAVRAAVAGYPNVQVQTRSQFEQAQVSSVNQLLGLVYALLALAVIIALIGIVNTLMLSVLERTREIGVRKAIGARKGDILMQFTLEAITLTAIGGVLGVLLGAIITFAIREIWDSLPATMSLFWASFGFLSAAAEGLLFGIYPAWKAANLDPIESLRYE